MNTRKRSLKEARDALSYIDGSDRTERVRMGFALYDGYGDEAQAVWQEWSAPFTRAKQSELTSMWRSFKRPGKTTIDSLFGFAYKKGWRSTNKEAKPLKPGQIKDMEFERERKKFIAEQNEKRMHERAAKKAAKVIEACSNQEHDYFERKGFPERQGLVIDQPNLEDILRRPEDADPFPPGDPLVIPAYIKRGEVSTLQFIFPASKDFPTGAKRFMGGGKSSGAWHAIGRKWCKNLVLVEGYLTGLTVFRAFERFHHDAKVIVTFNTNNLVSLAERAKKAIIIADNDLETEARIGRNPGVQAAEKTGLPYWISEIGGDANDFMMERGWEALTQQLRNFVNDQRRGVDG